MKPILEQIREYQSMRKLKAANDKKFPPFWNVEKDGSEGGIQADSLEQAQELADSAFETEMLESGEHLRNGAVFGEEVYFIKYEYDAALDDYKETERKKGEVFYEHYHGDFAEHNTQGL